MLWAGIKILSDLPGLLCILRVHVPERIYFGLTYNPTGLIYNPTIP